MPSFSSPTPKIHLPSIMEPILQAIIATITSFSTVSLLFLLVFIFFRNNIPPKSPPSLLPISSPQNSLPSLPQIPLSDLATATKNFSPDRIIGDGNFGFVYKAIFPSGAPAAVKRLSPHLSPFQGFREFRAEIVTLSRLRHPNLARLLAHCSSGPDRLLVYEFLPGGSLDSRLHDPQFPLPWPARILILRGVASGLAFLHHNCRPAIIHRDIKPANVLLDANSAPRIADFGLARVVEPWRGGYVAPENRVTGKGDVYSFGVMVMEVVTGRRPNWPVKKGDGGEMGMVEWIRGEFEEGREMEILDPLMGMEGVVENEVRKVLGVAYRMTEERPGRRPTIEDVIKLLDGDS